MTPLFASANLIKIFGDTDIFGQTLTVGLGIFSLVAWTVMFGKYNELNRLRELNHAFEQRLREERTLLDLVARGFLQKEIADQLKTTDRTVRNQLQKIYGKLQVSTPAEALALHHLAQSIGK